MPRPLCGCPAQDVTRLSSPPQPSTHVLLNGDFIDGDWIRNQGALDSATDSHLQHGLVSHEAVPPANLLPDRLSWPCYSLAQEWALISGTMLCVLERSNRTSSDHGSSRSLGSHQSEEGGEPWTVNRESTDS